MDKALILAVAAMSYCVVYPRVVAQTGPTRSEPVIISGEINNHRIVYDVDGERAMPDLLRVLNNLAEKRGHDVRVIVLIDSRASIAEFGNVEGTLSKAELSQIEYFIVNKAAHVMNSVKFGKTIPYSSRPVWQ
jgi:hypothetical protein